MKNQKTLLQRIIDQRTKPLPNQRLSQDALEEAEVYVQWVLGKLDTREVTAALNIKYNGAIHQKAGTALRNLAMGGYISITWNREESDEPTANA